MCSSAAAAFPRHERATTRSSRSSSCSRPSTTNLRAFFGGVERAGLTFAWEPRGPWPGNLVRELCAELDLVHCVDPLAARETHGALVYWRLHGIGGYRYRYTANDLERLRERSAQVLAAGRRPVHVLFNNMAMLDDARRFCALLERRPPATRGRH